MILLPQYRTSRRAAAAGDITVIQSVSGGTGTNRSVTFSATPADGEVIVLVMTCFGGSITPPGAFTEAVTSQESSTDRVSRIFYRVASSESSATYSVTNATNGGLMGYRLSACNLYSTGSNVTTSSTTHNISSANFVVPQNAFVVGAGVWSAALGSNVSANNSFGVDLTSNSLARTGIVSRKYTTGGAAENCTLTVINAVSGRQCLGVFAP